MTQARAGDTVKVHYTGVLDDGTIFDSTDGSEPLVFTLGSSGVIPAFERAIIGMRVGDTKTERIPASEAYGERLAGLTLEVDRSEFPTDMAPRVGLQFALESSDGEILPVSISAITESVVTLDANHPLAGEPLTFTIELVEITPVS